MSHPNPGSGGAPQTPGGSSNNPGQPGDIPPAGEPTPPQTVAYETYQKVLDEKKRKDAQLLKFQEEKKAAEEAALRDKEQWKTLYEQREAELKVAKDEHATLQNRVHNGMKLRSFLNAVQGEIAEQYFQLIDVEQIAVNPDNNMPDPASVAKAVKEFEQKYPLVIQRRNAGGLPSDAPRGGTGPLSYEDWLKLPLAEQRKRLAEVTRQ